MAVPVTLSLKTPRLLGLLADGELHSGESLARELGVSRAAVWKAVARLRRRGIDVTAEARRGYTLPTAVELLDRDRLCAAVSDERRARLQRCAVAFEVDSTNSRLLAADPPPPGVAHVLLSELQQAGRGRRGRTWIAPFGGSIALSLAWTFADAVAVSSTLSLCVGVAVARALERAGARDIRLKWPNDIWLADRKIGGVLIDMRAEAGGPAHVVIGVGVNVALTSTVRAAIEALGVSIAAVADACAAPPSRNLIAGAIIDELLRMLEVFERQGFGAFWAEWSQLDGLRDRPARIQNGEFEFAGTARGVDARGGLLLERDGRVHEFVSGEVSLRLLKDVI